jgi:hypothetical protein
MQPVKAYKCDFCKKIYLSISGVKKHEKRCWLNPARRSCITCSNLNHFVDPELLHGDGWECLKNICTPFKQKIERCIYWEESELPFNESMGEMIS